MNDGRGSVDDLISLRKKGGEGIALIADFKWTTATEALVEETPRSAGAFADRHVGPEPKASERRNFEPMRIMVGEDATPKVMIGHECFRCDDAARRRSRFLIAEWLEQLQKPV